MFQCIFLLWFKIFIFVSVLLNKTSIVKQNSTEIVVPNNGIVPNGSVNNIRNNATVASGSVNARNESEDSSEDENIESEDWNEDETDNSSEDENNKIKKMVIDIGNSKLNSIISLIKRKLALETIGTTPFVKVDCSKEVHKLICSKFVKYGISYTKWVKSRSGSFTLRIAAEFFIKIFKNCFKIVGSPSGSIITIPYNIIIKFTGKKKRKVIVYIFLTFNSFIFKKKYIFCNAKSLFSMQIIFFQCKLSFDTVNYLFSL